MTTKYKTKNEMTVCWGWDNKKMTIPKGSKVIPASNLPAGSGFWLKSIPKAYKDNPFAESWVRNYGIRIQEEEVESA
jgi:hypothetical protein